jgi:hypothetical protein
MTRLIERNLANWCTRKEAAASNRVSTDTIDRWIRCGGLRSMKDPGGRGVLVYILDFPPSALPAKRA